MLDYVDGLLMDDLSVVCIIVHVTGFGAEGGLLTDDDDVYRGL